MSKTKKQIQKFAKRQCNGVYPCPRCGRMDMNEKPTRNALSRRANVYICDFCGTDEAIEDAVGEKKPLESWAIVVHPAFYKDDLEENA